MTDAEATSGVPEATSGVLGELRGKARARLEPAHWDFFEGGAGRETALAENVRAFGRLALLPRVLRGAGEPDTAVELPGARASTPVLIAPTAFHRLAHHEGERATARAAAAAGTVLITSMASTTAVADVVAAAREVRADAAVWFQLYLQPRADVTEALVRRAEEAGCTALVVTADSPVFGRRARDDRNGFHDLPPGMAAENMRGLPGAPPDAPLDIAMSPALSWDHLRGLRERTELPILVKGVLHPDDARHAIGEGAAGLIVSNHGGRQLDAAPATVEALPRITEAVAGRIPVLLDGGIRSGADVVTALALGAAAVGVGRPVLWGLAAEGEAGVARVLAELTGQTAHVLALCGARDCADLNRDQVVLRGARGVAGG
ncbi:4-hydroxymandelate oxidase [Actinacidiphila yanglinensis]|uniref:4-hydroxymandelate oxidase n=1 Tax=Actinacidiphila yanglinensis TaxID=310779 RepID=A0A1H6CW59_9ACTN|nr:alpha-hydroxy acid oxidase [Actinacidiphila yanglinensis]SEG76943.1 4-hydroxymandelate oxidase [Actinacidiphila yanglinensis]